MLLVKVNFASGDYFVTKINATEQAARDYYEGKVFNVGTGPRDNMQCCTSVEVLQEAAPCY